MEKAYKIKNGRVVDPLNTIDCSSDLCVNAGKICSPADLPPGAIEIDANGCLVFPGFIDMHVHLREPGEEYKEDIRSGAAAAASGGFTAVACMPNTKPVNDNAAVCAMIQERGRAADARVYPIAAISKGCQGKNLAEFGELRDAGAVGVTDDGLPVSDSQLMRRAIEYASDFDLAVIAHCEDLALSTGVMNEGEMSTLLGLKGIPNAAESVMVYREIALAEFTGKRVHIAHVSAAESVELIRNAKARGVRVTAETAPHYFSLTEQAVSGYATNAKMNPPLRSEFDREAVIQGIKDGTIDVIATDHAPHSILEKEVEFDLAAFGIIGLETAIPLTLDLVRKGIIDETRMAQLLSVNPARILGVSGGSLSVGNMADVTIIDPELSFTYSVDQVVSKSQNSPFIGKAMDGRAVLTMVGGNITFSRLQI